MSSSLVRALALAAAFVGIAMAASAQTAATPEPPQMVGTWKGTAVAVSIGANPYRLMEGNGPYFSNKTIEFVFSITEQQGSRFAGTLSAGLGTEVLIGGLQPPNFASGVILDDDGRYSFTMRDATTIDLCYDHSYPKSKVVACYTLTKQ